MEQRISDRLGVPLFRWSQAASRRQKCLILLALDAAMAPVAARLVPDAVQGGLLLALVAACLSAMLGTHRVKLHAFENSAVARTALLSGALGAMIWLIGVAVGWQQSISATAMFAVLYFALVVGLRFSMLHVLLWACRAGRQRCRVLIYGAGTTGMQLAAALRGHATIEVAGFVDDDPALHGLRIAGLEVWPPLRLPAVVERQQVQRVLLAMPSAPRTRQEEIRQEMRALALPVLALPSIAQLTEDEGLPAAIRPVRPQALLGRDPLEGDLKRSSRAYAGRSILVTGAGGSIGSELCRQLMSCGPRRIVLLDLSEFALYTIEQELRRLGSAVEIIPILGSVLDAALLRRILLRHQVEIIFHAAAYKQVPLVEMNPLTGLQNNVFGTKILAEVAEETGVERFILISSDKAVRPANIMGASKRLAELVVRDLASRSDATVYSTVRFGNVLGSSGSVIPLFQSQIARGGPVTVTHDEVTRYFMTVGEAVSLVLMVGAFPKEEHRCGDVFVLDMGKPVRIRDLARQMIEASGYRVREAGCPEGDIEIVTVGLRPGEKLHEELLIGETSQPRPHQSIMRASEDGLSQIEVAAALRALQCAWENGDEEAARALVQRWVQGYASGAPRMMERRMP